MPIANPKFVQPNMNLNGLDFWCQVILQKAWSDFTPDDWLTVLRWHPWNPEAKAFMVSMHHRAKADWFLLNGKWVRKH